MEGNHCRLFDENLVRNIMISTGMSILEYVKEHASASATDVCDFVEVNADTIIWNTIEDMNNSGEYVDHDSEEEGNDPGNDEDDEETNKS
jgi:hypothetical protein